MVRVEGHGETILVIFKNDHQNVLNTSDVTTSMYVVQVLTEFVMVKNRHDHRHSIQGVARFWEIRIGLTK